MNRRAPAYTVLVLALVALIAQVDRNILAVLLPAIQKDFEASDAAMGLLAGSTFAIAYALAAVPVSRLADRGDRRAILSIAVAVWSLATMACGAVGNFWQLLSARIGVALGESPVTPTSMSMAADLFPEVRRGAVVGLIYGGASIGVFLGAHAGGELGEHFGWRAALLVVGAPGLLIAALVWFTVPEPARSAQEVSQPKVRFWPSLKYILARPTFSPLVLGYILLLAAYGGVMTWIPSFFVRVHHLSTAQAATGFGITAGLGAIAGNLLAGLGADAMARRGPRWRFYYCGGILLLGAPILTAAFSVTDTTTAWGLILLNFMLTGGTVSAVITAALSIVPPSLRAFNTALVTLFGTLIGGGVGPYLLGALSDILTGRDGSEGLQRAMMSAPIGFAAAGLAFLLASRTMDRDAATAAGAEVTTFPLETGKPNKSLA